MLRLSTKRKGVFQVLKYNPIVWLAGLHYIPIHSRAAPGSAKGIQYHDDGWPFGKTLWLTEFIFLVVQRLGRD